MTIPTTNPAVGDQFGNFPVIYTAPGRVHIQINAPGMSQIDIADVVLSDATLPALAYQVVPSSASPVFDTSLASVFQTTLTTNVTSPTFINGTSPAITTGRAITVKLCQDATGGRTFSWPASFLSPPNVSGVGANTCVDIPWWFDGTNWNLNGSSSLLATVSLSSVAPGTTGAGTYDFSGATIVKMPVAAGFSTSSNGSLGYDTTNRNWHFFDNGVDAINVVFPASATITAGDCATWNVSGGAITLGDNGGPCAATSTSTAHNFLTSYSAASGLFTKAQPGCADLSNASPSCSIDATNAGNLASGTVPSARLPNPSSSTLGGIESFAAVSHQWINQISTLGVPSATQPGCADLSNGAPSCSTDTTNASNISSGTLAAARMNPSISAHSYLGNNTGSSAAASFVQIVAADITPGTSGQCLNTSGSLAVWGSCAGTAGVQWIGSFPGNAIDQVAASSSSVQYFLHTACNATPCFGAGALNSVNKSFEIESYGNFGGLANTSELVTLVYTLDGSTNEQAIQFNPATLGGGQTWHIRVICSVTATGVSGQLTCASDADFTDNSSGVLANVHQMVSPATVIGISFNLTGAMTPKFGVVFGTASTSNVGNQLYTTTKQLN